MRKITALTEGWRFLKGNALSYDDHAADMAIIRELGANTLRLAHYQHAQEFYDLCDENSFRANPREIPTSPVTRAAPKWFHVYEKGGQVYVSSGREHANVSRVFPDRRLREDEFDMMLELFRRREKGAPVSAEAQASINSSYWFGIFKDLTA